MPRRRAYDIDFRPDSYWDHDDPVEAILAGVKGEVRRRLIRDVLTATGDRREAYDRYGISDLDAALYEAGADEAFIATLSRHIGPAALSGEYLPDMLPGEVEIARIVLESTTGDVCSLRGRRQGRGAGQRIHYRMVDEYETPWTLTQGSSRRPLPFGRLVRLIDTARFDGIVEECEDLPRLDAIRWSDGFDSAEEIDQRADFARVESAFYPELARWYEEDAEEWRVRTRLEWGFDGPGETWD